MSTVVVDGTYTSTGYNSPVVYSTANITVKNATLNAENSEALVIEVKKLYHIRKYKRNREYEFSRR